ncbi:MAG TPA: DUF3418 domain-containing protein, partial [Tepidisphaeraceae bacterium]|nr:DUF3418 domain-containing protein [Tepidisphaeraceae bacterium]
VDANNSVSLRVLDTPEAANQAMRAGLRRLFMLQTAGEVKSLARRLPIDQICLHYATIGDCDELRNDLVTAAADRALFADETEVRSREQFIDRADAAWRRLPVVAEELLEVAGQVLGSYHALKLKLDERYPPLLTPAIAEMKTQLAELVPRGFLIKTPAVWLTHLPRFLQAMEIRWRKLKDAGLARDTQASTMIAPLWQQYVDRLAEQQKHGIVDPQMQIYRWMMEELRVSLFAQELRTSIPISVQRLQKQWASTQSP